MPTTAPRYDVVIIGGGIAGASAAYALARRDLSVLICEAAQDTALEASGNHFGLITPYITDTQSRHVTLYGAGFTFTRELLLGDLGEYNLFRGCGALQLPSTKRLQKLLESNTPIIGAPDIQRVSIEDAHSISGIPLASPALCIPSAGYVEPRTVVERLITSVPKRIATSLSTRIAEIVRDGDSWCVHATDGTTIISHKVVICNAHEARHLSLTSWFPLEPIRGQTIVAHPTDETRRLRTVLSYDGYITPTEGEMQLIGAHYRHHDLSIEPSDHDTADILTRVSRWLPTVAQGSLVPHTPRVCFRTSTFDRLPYIGAVPDMELIQRESAQYQPGTNLEKKIGTPLLPGIFISAGHGSRGLLSAPIGGEIIARTITNESLGGYTEVAKVVDPCRGVWRKAVSNILS
jgi:tRNA 5-methylaminomethyl-2-thiouridine biosynthesis bifunctional protein